MPEDSGSCAVKYNTVMALCVTYKGWRGCLRRPSLILVNYYNLRQSWPVSAATTKLL